MTKYSLEEHLEELCPSCRSKHGASWNIVKEQFHLYKTTKCGNCNYVIFMKLSGIVGEL